MNESITYTAPGGGGMVGLISLAIYILYIIGFWKTFVKAGIPGWHSIIPILNVYDVCKIGLANYVGVFTLFSIIFPLIFVYPCIKVAKAFGKGGFFGFMLWILGGIFYIILGFGSAEYQGPQ